MHTCKFNTYSHTPLPELACALVQILHRGQFCAIKLSHCLAAVLDYLSLPAVMMQHADMFSGSECQAWKVTSEYLTQLFSQVLVAGVCIWLLLQACTAGLQNGQECRPVVRDGAGIRTF